MKIIDTGTLVVERPRIRLPFCSLEAASPDPGCSMLEGQFPLYLLSSYTEDFNLQDSLCI